MRPPMRGLTLAMRRISLAAIAVVLLASCATAPTNIGDEYRAAIAPGSVLRDSRLSSALEDRILAIDPLHVSDDDVRRTLSRGPTPRIINVHGGIYPVHLVMESFARFLMRMGYPESRLRDPGSGDLSHSPYESSLDMAGSIAWYYEHEGVRPMMIGHSQGGMQIVKVLYELAGKFDGDVRVYDPIAHAMQSRTTFVDPLTGATRPVLGLALPYASAVAAGGLATLLPNQWVMASRTFAIPDSVEDFTGFSLGLDLIAMNGPATVGPYHALGTARVRNVRLPAEYSHVFVVDTSRLGREENARRWINAWTPALAGQDPPEGVDKQNIQWAADVWFSIKQHWATEAQRFIRARRALQNG